MKEKLFALGFKEGKGRGIYFLKNLSNDLLFFQCIAKESYFFLNGVETDCIRLFFEWANDDKISKLEIQKPFVDFNSITKCIDDFMKLHREYL